MPDLLLELFSEEIPARMQAGAARDLERLVVGALTDRGLLFDGIKAFAGPFPSKWLFVTTYTSATPGAACSARMRSTHGVSSSAE